MEIYFRHRIQVPDRPPYLVSRPHITATLREVADRRLLTLTASAGYGKTSALIDFAHTAPPYPVCWYTLSDFDRDPWTFLSYMSAALAQQLPAMQVSMRPDMQREWTNAKLNLLQVLDLQGQSIILILDDWHLVDAVPEIQQLITEVLIHCPRCHLILSSRVYPSLPNLMLLAGRRQVVGIDELVLRAATTEMVDILEADGHIEVQAALVEQLTTQMDGWITGILLGYVKEVAATLSATELQPSVTLAPVYQFFAEQIFGQQAPETQAFLLETALLDDLTVSHCETILAQHQAWQILTNLRMQRVFITEVERGVWRYHPLFREFLQERYRMTQPKGYRDTALRIAAWYREQQYWARAFEMYVLADDVQSASAVISAGGEQMLMQGRFETLDYWFKSLSTDLLDIVALCLYIRLLIEYRNGHQEAQRLIHVVRDRAKASERVWVLLAECSFARHQGQYRDAVVFGEQALTYPLEPTYQVMVLRLMATSRCFIGEVQQAVAELQYALEQAANNEYDTAIVLQDLGFCAAYESQFAVAEEYFQQADIYWAQIKNSSRRAMTLNNLSHVQHHLGQYQAAYTNLILARECAREVNARFPLALTYIGQGNLFRDLQQWEAAEKIYKVAIQSDNSVHINSALHLDKLHLLIRQEQYAEARGLLDQIDVEQHPQKALIQSVEARIFIGEGLPDYAHTLLKQVGQTTGLDINTQCYMTLVQATLEAARIPADNQLFLQALTQIDQVADMFDSDTVLALDLTLSDVVLQRAAAAGWPRAPRWLAARAEAIEAGRQIVASESFGVVDQPEPVPEPTWELRALGPFQCLHAGEACPLTPPQQALLTCIVDAGPAGVTEDVLLEQVYGDNAPGSIRSQMSRIRKATGLALARVDRRYTATETIWYDVAVFEHASQVGTTDALHQAIELYQGEFLPALTEPSHWLVTRQLEVQIRYLDALERLADFYEATQPDQALTYYQQVWRLDPYRERAAHRLIALAQQQHNHALAQQVITQLAQHLATIAPPVSDK
ncbi:MAG: tetratricopeptide repeat protein [Chloroflexota bacterium]